MIQGEPLGWYLITQEALLALGKGLIAFLPKFFVAIIVFLIGWFVALGLGKLLSEVLVRLKLNDLFNKTGWRGAFDKAGISVNPSEFLGAIVKWVLVIAFLVASVNILGLKEFAGFLTDILGYLPNIIIAILIFVVTVIVADILEKIVVVSVEKVKTGYSRLAGTIVRWSIWFFAISAILLQLKIFPKELITSLFSGLIALLVISFGLAFGLGGKDIAAEVLRDLKKRLEEK